MIDLDYRDIEPDSLLYRHMMKFMTASLDRIEPRNYHRIYSQYLPAWKKSTFHMIEIGMYKGTSWHCWGRYFQKADITGVEVKAEFMPRYKSFYRNNPNFKNRMHMKICNSTDREAVRESFPLDKWKDKCQFIIDDGSHFASHQIATWHNFKHYLAPGGIYFIEDINELHEGADDIWEMLEREEKNGWAIKRWKHFMDYEGLTTTNKERGRGPVPEWMVVLEKPL